MFGTKVLFITLSSLLYLMSAQAEDENIPYFATLEKSGSKSAHCGATILTLSTFLTSASCVQGLDPKDYLVRSGNLKLGQGGKTVEVKEFRIHPNFNNKTLDYDLAVIIPKTPFPNFGVVTEYINNIKIAEGNENLEGKTGVATGWGADETSDDFSEILVYVELPILSRQVCEEYTKLTEHTFCGGDLSGEKGLCGSDAGGPFVSNHKLVGIISRLGCGKTNKPEVFTDVRVLKPWIDENTQ